MSLQIAVLADIHGNIWALDAVLRDAKARGVADFVNLGDILDGPLKPLETFQRSSREPFLATIQGNGDRRLSRNTPNAEIAVWLRDLPQTAVLRDEIFLCHGTPVSDETYLLEDVSSGQPTVRDDGPIVELLAGVRQPLIACGHSHIPRLVRLSTGQAVVNPGSVGLPAYEDLGPVKHRMETHSPHASYAIVERYGPAWNVQFLRVAYDHEAAAEHARSQGREDWSRALATGRAA